jgi:predicted secreted protein
MSVFAFDSSLQLLVASAYVRVAELYNVQDTIDGALVDVTTHESVDQWKECIQGLKEGTIQVQGFYNTTNNTHDFNVNGLLGLFDSGVVRTWRIYYAGRRGLQFSGLVTSFECSMLPDDSIEFTCELKATLVDVPPILLHYTEHWSYDLIPSAPLYTENWNYSFTPNASNYTEQWEYTSFAPSNVYTENWES